MFQVETDGKLYSVPEQVEMVQPAARPLLEGWWQVKGTFTRFISLNTDACTDAGRVCAYCWVNPYCVLPIERLVNSHFAHGSVVLCGWVRAESAQNL